MALSLNEAPFFRKLSASTLSRIQDSVYHRNYTPRQIVFFPDDPCDFVYWVREGSVRVMRSEGHGRELTLRHLGPGDVFGEECLLDKPQRQVYAEALETTTLCLMQAADFRRVLCEYPDLTLLLAQHLCKRAEDTEISLAEAYFKNVRARVAGCVLKLHNQAETTKPPGNGSVRGFRITHLEIASLVGSTRETTTCVLRKLGKEGLIEVKNRRVIVLDAAGLSRAASE
jgi:CRP/FNR family transcriptional regulator